ncbi:DUF1287 domain-containing protein [Dokdonella sp.]|uniref:DUF1287 domain-containing protein n=1 Tax=Dokdonella sp. TaxID=2291710 RepID=UPI003C3455CA
MFARCLPFLLGALAAGAIAQSPTDVGEMLAAAHSQVGVTVSYAPAYRRLSYPGGDVPMDRGVCTDVLVRALRAVDVDLQVEVHRDMRANFDAYPDHWGLKRPDPNIDHRRVPNLERFFMRMGKSLPLGTDAADFQPGDFVSWRLDGGQPHIGMVSGSLGANGRRPMIIHIIGNSVQVEDVLFDWKMTGHFRYFAQPASAAATGRPHRR